jgi:hypothetical protein
MLETYQTTREQGSVMKSFIATVLSAAILYGVPVYFTVKCLVTGVSEANTVVTQDHARMLHTR